jgi:hypothetical protein
MKSSESHYWRSDVSLGIFDEHVAVNPIVALTDADTTVPAELTQGGDRGTRLDDIILTSSAAGAVEVALILDDGSPHVLGVVAVPAGAGLSAAVPHVSAASLFPTPVASLIVASGTTVKAAMLVTLGASETVTVFGLGGAF